MKKGGRVCSVRTHARKLKPRPRRPSLPRSRTVIVVSTVAVLVSLLVEAPAAANKILRKDGNDTKGPLDLASVRVSHAGGANVFRVTTIAPFTNKQVNGKLGFFEIDLDTNGDKNPNYFVVVVRRSGKMRGWLFKGNGDLITRKLGAARLSPRSVRVTLPLAKVGDPKSYDFAAFSAFFAGPCTNDQPCIDSIPNKYPLVRHDLTAPTFTWNPTPPTYSTENSAYLNFSVSFSVADDTFGSGVRDWTLQKRAVGTSTWLLQTTGTSLNPTRNVTDLAEGTSYDVRVIVRDKQGNRRISPLARTSVPYDDANLSFFTYTAGTWTDVPTTGQFRGTSTEGMTGDVVSFDVVAGHEFCVLGGPGSDDAAATLVVGGGAPEPIVETSGTAAREQIHCETPPGPDVDVVLTVTAGTFVLDGVAIAG
jgi:hypothetical protein